MCRDVLQAGQEERVAVRAMPIVTHEGALYPLRVVVLAAAESVIDEQQRAMLQTGSKRACQRRNRQRNLAQVRRLHGNRGGGIPQRTPLQATLRPGARTLFQAHTALPNALLPPCQQMDRQRVQHFVRKDYSGKYLRQRVDPFDPVEQIRHPLLQRLALAPGQIRTDLQNQIAPGQAAVLLQGGEQIRGKPAGTRPEFHHHAAGLREYFANLAG